MKSMTTEIPVLNSSKAISGRHISWLAQTYDRTSRPVWIHDLSNRCIYRNWAAQTSALDESSHLRFELLNHNDHIIGHLTVGEN